MEKFKVGDSVAYRDILNNRFGTGVVVDIELAYEIEVFPAVEIYAYLIKDDNTKQNVFIVNNEKDGVVEKI